MSNFINPSVLAAESLDQLDYELVAGGLMYRDRTEDFASVRGLKVGSAVTIRTVSEFETTEFTGVGPVVPQQIQQSSTQLTIEKHFDCSIEITARERALNLDGLRKEVITPAMQSLAQDIDTYLLTKATESQGLYVNATPLASAALIAQANKAATLQQIAKINRIGLVNEDLEAVLLGQDAFTKFDTRGEDGADALRNASMGFLMGVDWFSTVNFPNVTRTAGDGATTLDSALSTSNLQGSSTLVVDSTTDTFLVGDKIQIAGAKRAYTVATETAATATAIPLVEQINENLAGLDGAAITVISDGTSATYEGIYFNPGAYGFAAPPLDPAAGAASGVATAEGMSVRVTEAYDILSKKTYWSFDLLCGAKAVDPRKSMLIGNQ